MYIHKNIKVGKYSLSLKCTLNVRAWRSSVLIEYFQSYNNICVFMIYFSAHRNVSLLDNMYNIISVFEITIDK